MCNNITGAAKNLISWIYEAGTQATRRIGNAFARLVKNRDAKNLLTQGYTHAEMGRYSLADFSIKSVDSFEVISRVGLKGSSNQSKQCIDFNKPIPGLEKAIEQLNIQAKKLEQALDKNIKHLENRELLDNLKLQRAKVKPLGNWQEEIRARTKARTEARLARRAANKA